MGISICPGCIKCENNNEGNMEWIVMRQITKHIREKKPPNVSMNFMFRPELEVLHLSFSKFNCYITVAATTFLRF